MGKGRRYRETNVITVANISFGLVLLLIWVSLYYCQNCALHHMSSGQLLCPSDPVAVFHKSLWLCFLEKKNNNFHYEIPPGFIFLISSHMLLWLWVKRLQGFCCEAMKNIALNSKEFICFTSWVCSSQSGSCAGATCASPEVQAKESCFSPPLPSLLEAEDVMQTAQQLSVVARCLWRHTTTAHEGTPCLSARITGTEWFI